MAERRALVALHRRGSGSGEEKREIISTYVTEAKTAFAAELGLDDSG